ncbi:MAG: hypothetical protein HY975_04240, partial [Candidatus Kerfeldbacteria bacterium]|nr:hypothetical protein [Candidatus Kerfeldbacteria bacterium]
ASLLREALSGLLGRRNSELLAVEASDSPDGLAVKIKPETVGHEVIMHLQVVDVKVLDRMPRPTRRRATLRKPTG